MRYHRWYRSSLSRRMNFISIFLLDILTRNDLEYIVNNLDLDNSDTGENFLSEDEDILEWNSGMWKRARNENKEPEITGWDLPPNEIDNILSFNSSDDNEPLINLVPESEKVDSNGLFSKCSSFW